MCNTLTVASIFGCLETIAYLGLTTYFVLCLTYLCSTVDWDLKNDIDFYEINESGIDLGQIYMIGILLGSIGALCSLLLVIGLIKRCQLLLVPWLILDMAILVTNTVYAVNTKSVLHLSHSVLWFITWCFMVSVYQTLEKLESKSEAQKKSLSDPIASPYNKFANLV